MKYCLFLILLYSLNSCTGSDTQHTTAERSKIYSIPGLQWRIKTNGVVLLQPYIQGNNIYITTENKALSAYPLGNKYTPSTDLTCLDKRTGKINWTFHSNSFLSKPLITEKEVLIGSLDSYLYALNIKDGKINWKFKSPGAIWNSPFFFHNQIVIISEEPVSAEAGNTMSDSCYISCLNKEDRRVAWTQKLEHDMTTPGIYHGKIYYFTLHAPYLLDSLGAITKIDIPDSLKPKLLIMPFSVFDRGIIYSQLSITHELVAYDILQRKLQWRAPLTGLVACMPQAGGDSLFVLDGRHTLIAYHVRDGNKLWQYSNTKEIFRFSSKDIRFIYVTTANHKLIALNRLTSQQVTEFDLQADSHCEPVVDNGIIYIGTEDSSFYAITAPNP